MSMVKGTTMVGRMKFVERYHGAEARREVLARLADRNVAQRLEHGGLRSEWYPFAAFVDLTETIDRVCGEGDGRLYRRLAGQVAEDDLSTVYRAFFRIATPAFILGKAAQVWRQYYDSGTLQVIDPQPGRVELEIVDFATPNRTHCESVAGWVERTIGLTGARDAGVEHASCRAAGGARCRFLATWKA